MFKHYETSPWIVLMSAGFIGAANICSLTDSAVKSLISTFVDLEKTQNLYSN